MTWRHATTSVNIIAYPNVSLRTIGYDMEACNYFSQHHCLSEHAMVTNKLDVLDAS
jgi:hypothetical protein